MLFPKGKIGFLIDMDGVLFFGDRVLPDGKAFIDFLKGHNIPHIFLTNGSRLTPLDYQFKLKQILDIEVSEEHFYTASLATADFIAAQKKGASAYVLGEGGLLQALYAAGIATNEKNPDYVVVGETRSITTETLERAINLILSGAKLIVTNNDPPPHDLKWPKPAAVAIAALLEVSTGHRPLFMGKPSSIMMRYARKKLELRTEETIMIGDTMETDIFGGVALGYYTILMLTGITRTEDLARYAYQPDAIANTLQEVMKLCESTIATLKQ